MCDINEFIGFLVLALHTFRLAESFRVTLLSSCAPCFFLPQSAKRKYWVNRASSLVAYDLVKGSPSGRGPHTV